MQSSVNATPEPSIFGVRTRASPIKRLSPTIPSRACATCSPSSTIMAMCLSFAPPSSISPRALLSIAITTATMPTRCRPSPRRSSPTTAPWPICNAPSRPGRPLMPSISSRLRPSTRLSAPSLSTSRIGDAMEDPVAVASELKLLRQEIAELRKEIGEVLTPNQTLSVFEKAANHRHPPPATRSIRATPRIFF